jgi:hypothetical protein
MIWLVGTSCIIIVGVQCRGSCLVAGVHPDWHSYGTRIPVFFYKIKSKTKETVMRRHFQRSCRFMPALDEKMQFSSCESGLACILPRTQETRMQMPLFFSWPAVSQGKHVLDGQGAEGTCASCVLTEEREARRNQAIRAGNCDPPPNVIIIISM